MSAEVEAVFVETAKDNLQRIRRLIKDGQRALHGLIESGRGGTKYAMAIAAIVEAHTEEETVWVDAVAAWKGQSDASKL